MVTFFIFLTFSVLTSAAERPKIPAPGEDLVLTNGKSAKDFFESRKQNTSCIAKWRVARTQYRTLQKELYEMIAQGTPAPTADKKEAEMLAAKNKLHDLNDVCGPCATQKVGKITLFNPTEYWYVTDGSCYIPEASGTDAFNKVSSFLLNTKTYARQRGGFDSILEFIPIDKFSGALLPHNEHLKNGDAISTYIAVRAKFGLAFSYTFDNQIEIVESNNKKEFILRFNGFERPENLSIETFDTTLSGTKRELAANLSLTRVIGMWYFNTDGYYRYFTAADFESPIFSIGDSTARRTLMDTVFDLAERGL